MFDPPIVHKEEMEEEQEGSVLLGGLSVSRQTKACNPTENLNHHEAEDGDISPYRGGAR
jgi:hypothetical protein